MKKTTGNFGEELAAKYVKKQGMKILERNFRTVRGEIDIVAKDDDQLVFIEVKTNRRGNSVAPELRVNVTKQKKLGKMAQQYLQNTSTTDTDCRFDVIGVILNEKGKHDISHIRNAFWL